MTHQHHHHSVGVTASVTFGQGSVCFHQVHIKCCPNLLKEKSLRPFHTQRQDRKLMLTFFHIVQMGIMAHIFRKSFIMLHVFLHKKNDKGVCVENEK